MDWNHSVIFITPISLVEVARKISRAIDYDSGGYDAFQWMLSPTGTEPATHVGYSTPCREDFLDRIAAVSIDSALLKSAIDADYANRWPEDVPPTLLECIGFNASCTIFTDTTRSDALLAVGLVDVSQNLGI